MYGRVLQYYYMLLPVYTYCGMMYELDLPCPPQHRHSPANGHVDVPIYHANEYNRGHVARLW